MTSRNNRILHLYSFLLVLLFGLMITTPLGAWFLRCGPKPTYITGYNRPDPKPDFLKIPILQISKSIEKFAQENMPFRTQFLSMFLKNIEFNLGIPMHWLLKGKNGEYFAYKSTVLEYMGFNSISKNEWFRIKSILVGRYCFFKLKNIQYLFVLAPDKTSVYQELLSCWLFNRKDKTKRDDWIEILKSTSIPVLDVAKYMTENKKFSYFNKVYDVYHWNGMGQYTCASFIYKWMHKNVFCKDDLFLDKNSIIKYFEKEYPPFNKENVPYLCILSDDYFEKDKKSIKELEIITNKKINNDKIYFL